MKIPILPAAVVLTTLFTTAQAQEVLVKDKGVALSYKSEYTKSITCGTKKFAQYKITAYLENNSGHTINIGYSDVSHNGYRNKTDVSPCEHPRQTRYLFDIKNSWGNASSESGVYYVLVPEGDELPQPSWNLGKFEFID
ncbi:MAG: hypothetical protein J0I84_01080 [Terrimonas sp.]|nr:hypothetical protein [Terrimonas sp.]OJY81347.1 MAG: hypothetical protein BGP13_15210 [Sphingobacteriales bacterium 40-81]